MQSADLLRPAAGSAGSLSDSVVAVVEKRPTLRRSASSSACFHRPAIPGPGTRQQHRTSSESKREEMISPEEYAALPPSIQRKYFSSAERLYIAREYAAQRRKKQAPKQKSPSCTSSADLTFESTSAALNPTPPLQCPPSTSHCAPNRPAKLQSASSRSSSESTPTTLNPTLRLELLGYPRPNTSHSMECCSSNSQPDLSISTPDQAQWFLALPEKARRQYFSKEEQAQLIERCEEALRNPQSAKLPVLSQPPTEVCERVLSESSQRPVEAVPDAADHKESLDTDTTSLHTLDTVDTEMAIFKLYSRRRPSEATKVTCVPPEATNPPPSQPQPPPPSSQHKPIRKPFHRALALTPIALPPPTLAPVPASVLSPTTIDAVALFAARAALTLAPAPSPVSSPATIRANILHAPSSPPQPESVLLPSAELLRAKHTYDPKAQEQLRDDVATPPVVDEVVGSGLLPPELIAPPSSDIDRPSSSRKATPVLELEADDASFSSHGPPTPTAEQDHEHPGFAQQACYDSGIGLPVPMNAEAKGGDRHKTSSFANRVSNRDMKIRETLAHLGLCSSEEARLYSYQRTLTSGVEVAKADLLALERLPVCDDATGAHGAFAVHGGDEHQQHHQHHHHHHHHHGMSLRRAWKGMMRH